MNRFEKAPASEPPEMNSWASFGEIQPDKPHSRQKSIEEQRAKYPEIFNPNKREMYSRIEQFLEKIDIDDAQNLLKNYGNNYRICSKELVSYLSSILRLKDSPRVIFEPQENDGDEGFYSYHDNTITMFYQRRRGMDMTMEDVITAAHETWHARQALLAHEYKSHPDSVLYRRNIKYYIEPDEDYDGYKTQRYEWEAENFGKEFYLRFCTVESKLRRSYIKQLGRKIKTLAS